MLTQLQRSLCLVTFGLFVKVLLDMDLNQPLRFKVLVENVGFA